MTKRGTLRIIVSLVLAIMVYSLGGLVIAQAERVFTPQELAKFNGKNGVLAYVAVNGVVYDLSTVPEWAGGRHSCPGAIAGKDLSLIWNLTPRSHRNTAFLKRYPVVGKMTGASVQPTAKPSSDAPSTTSIGKVIIWGLIIAVIITIAWLLLRMKKK